MIKIPRPPKSNFKINDSFRLKLKSVVLIDRKRKKISLLDADIEAIESALRALLNSDRLELYDTYPSILMLQSLSNNIKQVEKSEKRMRSLSAFFASFDDDQLYGMSFYLSMSIPHDQPQSQNLNQQGGTDRINRIFHTLKLIANSPQWFSDVVSSIKANEALEKREFWLYHTLDDLCEVLKRRNVIVKRNRNGKPFGVLIDALSLVRSDIVAARIESYIQRTRKGVGPKDFGRRWGEIEEDLPKAEIASPQLSDLDPEAGSDRHPSSTT